MQTFRVCGLLIDLLADYHYSISLLLSESIMHACPCWRNEKKKSKRDGLCDEGENVVINGDGAVRSSVSTKRSRAAAIHNESERVRNSKFPFHSAVISHAAAASSFSSHELADRYVYVAN